MVRAVLLLAALCSSRSAAGPTCCWSKWGDASSCGDYSGDGHGGLCNTDFKTPCSADSDCTAPAPSPVPPTPTPVPTPTPPPMPTPVPTPSPVPTPTPTPTPGPAGLLDIIGYYGNSGNAVQLIPKIAEVHENYNVIILTFATISGSGDFGLDIQGPYEKDLDVLASDLKAWRAGKDKWGRQRLALISIGGQNGHWPSGVSSEALEAGLDKFMERFGLDGLDIDLEGGSVGAASSLVTVIQSLTGRGKVVTAAPEAAQGPLGGYKDLLKYLTWVHPQFYNNPPNAVTTPWTPTDAAKWPAPWGVGNWQQEDSLGQGEGFWAAVLEQIGAQTGLEHRQLGMLFPAATNAAGAQNNWDVDKLVSQVRHDGITHVGNWALAYDRQENWKWAEGLGKLNDEIMAIVV